MVRSARIRPRFNLWELLVVALGLGWALIEAYRNPARFSDFVFHSFASLMVVAGCAVVWLLALVIIGVIRRRERRR